MRKLLKIYLIIAVTVNMVTVAVYYFIVLATNHIYPPNEFLGSLPRVTTLMLKSLYCVFALPLISLGVTCYILSKGKTDNVLLHATSAIWIVTLTIVLLAFFGLVVPMMTTTFWLS